MNEFEQVAMDAWGRQPRRYRKAYRLAYVRLPNLVRHLLCLSCPDCVPRVYGKVRGPRVRGLA